MITDYQNFGFTYDMVNGFFPKKDSNEFNFFIRDKKRNAYGGLNAKLADGSFKDIEGELFEYSLVDKITKEKIATINEEITENKYMDIIISSSNPPLFKIIKDLTKIYNHSIKSVFLNTFFQRIKTNYNLAYEQFNGFFPKEDSNEFNFFIRDKTIIQRVYFGDIKLDYFQYSLVDKISNEIIAMIREEDDIYTCKNIKMDNENLTFSQKIREDLSKIYLKTYKEDAFSDLEYDLARRMEANKLKPNYFIIVLYVVLTVLVVVLIVLIVFYWKISPRMNVAPAVEITNLMPPVDVIPATRTNNVVIPNSTQAA